MPNINIVGFALFICLFLISRVIHARAIRTLSSENKVKYIDAYGQNRLFFMACVLVGVFFLIITMHYFYSAGPLLVPTVVFTLVLLVIISQLWTQRRLKQAGLPTYFLRRRLFSTLLLYLSILLLFVR